MGIEPRGWAELESGSLPVAVSSGRGQEGSSAKTQPVHYPPQPLLLQTWQCCPGCRQLSKGASALTCPWSVPRVLTSSPKFPGSW